MSIASVLARGRRAAERRMVDACVIRRAVGELTDVDTGRVTITWETVYTGKCEIQQSPTGGAATPQDAGEAHKLMLPLVLKVPVSVVGVRADDEVQITASLNDPDLVDVVGVVHDLSHKSHATCRRLGIREATS